MIKLFTNFNKYYYSYLRRTLGNIEWVLPKYRIPTLRNINTMDNVEHKYMFYNSNYSFSYLFSDFIINLSNDIQSKNTFSLLRLGDGEMFYLNNNIHGNLITRHGIDYSISPSYIKTIIDYILSTEYILAYKDYNSMTKHMPKALDSYIGNYYHVYLMYMLVSSRVLFHMINNINVGIIGSHDKVDLIRTLMTYDVYKTYIGLNRIEEYIQIPEYGAAKDFNETYFNIKKQMSGICDIYLVGMGISKLFVIPKLAKETSKIFIDIGSGIDAMAGIIPHSRPYFGNWINYKLSTFDYSKIDILSFDKYSNKTNTPDSIFLN